MRHKYTKALVTLSATLLLLSTPAFAQKKNSDFQNIGIRDINAGGIRMALPDLDAEIAMGRQAASELERNVTLVQDPVVAEYVNRVGQTIVRNSDAKVPFVFRVVDSDEINSISLPGGFVFVNKGLILACDSEAELASIIAHGVAQVAARHAVEQQQKAALIDIAAIPLQTFGGGIPGMITQQAATLGVPITFLAFNRKAEEEADFLGLQYLYKAGYDPTAMVSFFEKVQVREAAGAKVSVLFASHPQTEERKKMTQQDIATYFPVRAVTAVPPAEFEGVKARLANRN